MNDLEAIVREMHNLYDSWSQEYAWETQARPLVAYDDLPQANKCGMEKVAQWHLGRLRLAVADERKRCAEIARRNHYRCGKHADFIAAEIERGEP